MENWARDLAPTPRLDASDRARLEAFDARMQAEVGRFLGYPCNAGFDYRELDRFLRYPMNNVGDPYVPSNYHANTHEFEREVLADFGRFTHAPEGQTWGYVTGGGTEGNHYGLYLARELYPEGLVYYSEDTHYSVSKILRVLHARSIMIRSQPDGRLDLDDLRATIRIHRDVPPILFLNAGTTMKGAVDDVRGVRAILHDLAIPGAYLHVDAALHGMILPFVDHPPVWDFAAGVDSLAISGHKFIGSPMPCGVVLARRAHVDRIARSVEYIGSLDTTLSGSRNALAPLYLWYALRSEGRAGFERRVRHCLATADHAIERLTALGVHPWRHANSPIVVFDRPSDALVSYWQLAAHGAIAHVITMPHVTTDHIDRFVASLAEGRPPAAVAVAPAPLADVGTPAEAQR